MADTSQRPAVPVTLRTAAALLLVTAGCTSAGVAQPASSRQSGPATTSAPARHRHARHHHHRARPPAAQRDGVPAVDLPRRSLTPGVAFAVGTAQICVSGYSSSVRNVPHVRGGRGLRSLRRRARSLRARGRPPDLARDRRLQRDQEPVARALRRPVGRPHQGRPREPAARAGLLGPARAPQGAADRGAQTGWPRTGGTWAAPPTATGGAGPQRRGTARRRRRLLPLLLSLPPAPSTAPTTPSGASSARRTCGITARGRLPTGASPRTTCTSPAR